ncbi:hypothetical protein GGTG_11098 [Gaeumannomyces tritici R3-111a-1]|uniref:Uncharacterized protein n=1 Tax=Gaeumannomyces tritici (strain R3-111a-1) TaxID=644352 RepID=J3PC75_GAET3|nr:hypothetical protein GGTG_11098 [Gaeumannomyces tritici R3-111a-1]EJT71845.1 hypothetical protein GGTG_11098 [Gaeumannomyces tritici R3-111a-1]
MLPEVRFGHVRVVSAEPAARWHHVRPSTAAALQSRTGDLRGLGAAAIPALADTMSVSPHSHTDPQSQAAGGSPPWYLKGPQASPPARSSSRP